MKIVISIIICIATILISNILFRLIGLSTISVWFLTGWWGATALIISVILLRKFNKPIN